MANRCFPAWEQPSVFQTPSLRKTPLPHLIFEAALWFPGGYLLPSPPHQTERAERRRYSVSPNCEDEKAGSQRRCGLGQSDGVWLSEPTIHRGRAGRRPAEGKEGRETRRSTNTGGGQINKGGQNTTKVKRREGRSAGVGVELQTEIEGFHLPTASLCLSARPVIKEAAGRAP